MTDDYQPYRKGTVLAISGPCEHLHVVCNDPVHYPINDSQSVLVVNVSSVKFGVPHDDTCILNVGDHTFIKHESYIVYKAATIWRLDNIARKISDGALRTYREDVNDPVFQRILAGFDISDHVSMDNHRFWKKYCR